LPAERRQDATVVSNLAPESFPAHLFHDEKEIHAMSSEVRDGNVRNYGDDFTLQIIQELLQFALVAGHLDIESVYPVFHKSDSFLSLNKA
jgi:hypothetical protein